MTTDKLIRIIMALVVAYLLFHLGRFASNFIAHGFFHVPPHYTPLAVSWHWDWCGSPLLGACLPKIANPLAKDLTCNATRQLPCDLRLVFTPLRLLKLNSQNKTPYGT